MSYTAVILFVKATLKVKALQFNKNLRCTCTKIDLGLVRRKVQFSGTVKKIKTVHRNI